MKKFLSLALAALLLLSLAACGEAPAPSSSASSAGSSQADALTPVTSEAEVRALYENEGEAAVVSIQEYQGDYLVTLEEDGGAFRLEWVYGQSGIRRQMLWLDEPILSCEIGYRASIEVVTGGPSVYDGYLSFPHVERSALDSAFDELGRELPYSPYDRAISSSGTYWAGAGESYPMGTEGRREAIRSAQIDAEGLTVAFAPLADGSDFLAAACTVPHTEVGLSEDGLTLTVTMHDTFLDSGTLAEGVDTDFLREYGSLYPESFPAGALAGSCVLIEKAELRQVGNDAVLTATLDASRLHGATLGDSAFRFTAETGYTGPGDAGVFLRIMLRAAEPSA